MNAIECIAWSAAITLCWIIIEATDRVKHPQKPRAAWRRRPQFWRRRAWILIEPGRILLGPWERVSPGASRDWWRS